MAKNSLDPEELFRKSEDEMSDIEKMMAEILSESEESGRKKTAGELKHDEWVDFSKLTDNSFAEKAG